MSEKRGDSGGGPLKSLTDFRIYFAAAVAGALGVFLLYAGGRDDWFEDRDGAQVLSSQLGSVLIAAVALSLLWELVGKRSFSDEILAKVGLGSDVERAGLIRMTDQYLKEVEWDHYFRGVKKLDIVVAYGRTWRRTHWDQLTKIASDASARIRVILPDPAHNPSMVVLADRFARTPAVLKSDIEEAIRDFCSLRAPGGATVDIFLHRGDQVFSGYRLDQIAIITLYSHSRKRKPVPTLVCQSGGTLFDFLYDEIGEMIEGLQAIDCAQYVAAMNQPDTGAADANHP